MKLFSLKNRVFLIAVTLALVFSLNLFSQEAKGFLSQVFSPLQGFFWDIGQASSNFFAGIFHAASFQEQNRELGSENLKFRQELISLQGIEKENESLRTALSLGLEKEFSMIPSRIIGKDPSQDILFLDKGSREGVQEGMSVITPEKVAVGKIQEVLETSSRVMLLSHQASSFDAKILREGVVGAVRGQGRYQALLDLIPLESVVAPGDIVVSATLGGVFPENLLIGEIKEVRTSDTKSFQQAALSLFFNVGKAGIVFIIERE